MLMLTAIPPSITPAEAVALTGSDEAPRLLDYLYRRHLFTDRRRGNETTYHYHALFREFLLEEARKRLRADERRAASARAAALLAARGAGERSAGALSRRRRIGGDARAILANALDWARQGRAQTLSDWIEALPRRCAPPIRGSNTGSAARGSSCEPPRGRPALERAYEAFRAAGDLRGQALALNTIVTGYYYEWANFAPLDRWLPEFERLLEPAASHCARSRERAARTRRAT